MEPSVMGSGDDTLDEFITGAEANAGRVTLSRIINPILSYGILTSIVRVKYAYLKQTLFE
jgi:hypothetical protein